MPSAFRLLALASLLVAAACVSNTGDAHDTASATSVTARTARDSARPGGFDTTRMAPSAEYPSSLPKGYVVDSAIPIPEAIRRFQATVPKRPKTLMGGATSIDDLFRKYVRALVARDTAGLRAVALTRAEFAWLYYPDSKYTREPDQLQPDFLWHMMNTNGEEGVGKALQRYGGASWTYLGHTCADMERHGTETLRTRGPCRLRLRSPDGVVTESPLVDEVTERDGRFKLTGFANEL